MTLKKIARKTAITIAVLLVFVFLLQAFVGLYLQNKVRYILENRVTSESGGKYKVILDESTVNIFSRSLTLDQIAIIPVHEKLKDDAAISLVAERITLKGISVFSFLKNKELNINELVFSHPHVIIFQKDKIRDDSAKAKVTLFDIVSKELEGITIAQISLTNAVLKIFNKAGGKEAVLYSDENEIRFDNFLVDSKVDSMQRHFLSEKFSISMKSCVYHPPGGMYTLKAKNLFTSYHDSILSVDSLQLIPVYKKKSFSKVAGQQVSRVKLEVKDIRFSSMNVQLFLERNWFVAEKLDIGDIQINVNRDKNVDLKQVRKPSLQRVIFNIPFRTKLDTIRIKNADIVYEHLAEGRKEPGKVSFNKLSGLITGLNNDTSSMKNNGKLRLKAKCRFMNEGRLNAVYDFPLNTDEEIFTCKGSLGKMSLKSVNKMLEKTMNGSIKSGVLDSLSFSFNANDKYSSGTMGFFYHDLEVDIVAKDEGRKRKFFSFLANELIIKDSNPGKKGEVRITDIYYPRYPYKFFFYYTWKSLQSGIMSAVGVNSEKLLKKSDDK